jgi:hypothetical protein
MSTPMYSGAPQSSQSPVLDFFPPSCPNTMLLPVHAIHSVLHPSASPTPFATLSSLASYHYHSQRHTQHRRQHSTSEYAQYGAPVHFSSSTHPTASAVPSHASPDVCADSEEGLPDAGCSSDEFEFHSESQFQSEQESDFDEEEYASESPVSETRVAPTHHAEAPCVPPPPAMSAAAPSTSNREEQPVRAHSLPRNSTRSTPAGQTREPTAELSTLEADYAAFFVAGEERRRQSMCASSPCVLLERKVPSLAISICSRALSHSQAHSNPLQTLFRLSRPPPLLSPTSNPSGALLTVHDTHTHTYTYTYTFLHTHAHMHIYTTM